MKYNPDIHKRHSIRLRGYDYSSPGVYFITICTQNREPMFGFIQKGSMILNDSGEIIKKWWEKIHIRFDNIKIDFFVIMPNHLHGIINIVGAIPCNRPIKNNIRNNINHIETGKNTVLPLQKNNVEIDSCIDPDSYIKIGTEINSYKHHKRLYGLPRHISWFKRMTTNEYIKKVRYKNWEPFDKKLWQRNYYEHIIRNDIELKKYRQYIIDNPEKWDEDEENPNKIEINNENK